MSEAPDADESNGGARPTPDGDGDGDGGDDRLSPRGRTEPGVDRSAVVSSVLVFLVFGLGTTLSFLLFFALLPRILRGTFGGVAPVGGGAAAVGLSVGILFGPLLAVVSGLVVGQGRSGSASTSTSTESVALSTGVGAAAGFLAMVFVQLVLVVLLGGGGGAGLGGGQTGRLVVPVLGLAVGVGATGAGAGYVVAR